MGVDRGYLPYAAAVMRSALDHHDPGRLRFHFLHDGGVPAADTDRLARWLDGHGAALDVVALDSSVVDGLPGSRIFRPIVSMRLLLPRLLPETDRVLYLDADTLVCDSLEPLWATDLASAPIGAVRNVVEAEMDAHVRALGLEPGAVFNSGVLLMDLAAMRAIGSVERLLSIGAERREQLWWPDQDVLNLGFAGAWRPLAARWNAQNSYYTLAELAANVVPAGELAEARDRPGIRHFEGPSTCKPWHYLTTSPHWREFRDALARTPWAGEAVLEDRTPATRLIRRLPQDRQLPVYRWWYRQRGLASRVRARAAAARGRVRRVDPHHSARG